MSNRTRRERERGNDDTDLAVLRYVYFRPDIVKIINAISLSAS